MRITERQLRQIIREELERDLEDVNEGEGDDIDLDDRPWHHPSFDRELDRKNRGTPAPTPSAPRPVAPSISGNWGANDTPGWGPYHNYDGPLYER